MRLALKIKPAFTLSELLVALGVIGIISALLVPKIFANTAVIQKRVQLRSIITPVERFFHEENLRGGQFNDNTLRRQNLTRVIQFARMCSIDQVGGVDALTPCLPTGAPAVGTVGGIAYVFGELEDNPVLQVRADPVIYGLISDVNTSTEDEFWIDLNGNRGPNRIATAADCSDLNGSDRFRFSLDNTTGEITYMHCADEFLAQ